MYTPPYAAYARPALAVSIRVSASAKAVSAANPGMSHNGLLFSLSQAQNAKQPPISPNAASAYHGSEVNIQKYYA